MSRVPELPKRPSLPPTLAALVGVLAGEGAMLRMAWPLPACAGVGAAILGMGLLLEARRPLVARVLVFVAVGLISGLAAGSVASWSLSRFSERMGATPVSSWSLEVTVDPSLGEHGYFCRALARRDGLPSGSVWVSSEDEPSLGESIVCVGRFEPAGDDEWGVSSRAQGVAGTVRVVRVLRGDLPAGPYGALLGLREEVAGRMGARASGPGALVAASVCGYRVGMDEFGLTDLFSACGVSHLVAVSGGHLVIVAGVLAVVLEGLGLGPRVRSIALIAVSGAFVVFCGAPVSAVRSLLMLAPAAGAELAGRRGHALSAVCLVGVVMSLADAFVSGQLGFLLSVASVIGLCVLSPYFSYVLRVAFPTPAALLRSRVGRIVAGALSSLRETLAATLVAQVVTAPMTVTTFGELSLAAPLANLVLAPPFVAVIALGMLSVPLCCLPGVGGLLSDVLLVPARACASLAIALLRPISRLPLATVPVEGMALPLVLFAVAVGVYLLWPQLTRPALLGVATVFVGVTATLFMRWRLLAPARVVVLDVGQGDAILVQDGASAVLVDTGPGDAVVSGLARQHVMHLDAVILTHLHDDHVGGLDDLGGFVRCERVIVARGVGEHVPAELAATVEGLTGGAVEEVSYGDSLRVGGFLLEVISPVGEVSGNENEDSIELSLAYAEGGRSLTALLTGDAEEGPTGEALSRADVGDIDLLKVGHHGSAVSLSPEEARQLSPEVSVASAGEGNRYGHPTAECVNALEEAGSLFLCTKDTGDVEVRPGRSGPSVRYDGHREG